MLFNSGEFFFFFVVIYVIYLFSNFNWQNWLLLIASYFFYGSWDPRFLALILASTIIDYISAIQVENNLTKGNKKRAKLWLLFSIFSNLSILGFFKYFNFFVENFITLFKTIGIDLPPMTLHILLPIGISYYTFQSMSYTIDVYRGQQKATRNLRNFALYVSFFPQLMAGPIERARKLLPQMEKPRTFRLDYIHEGGWLILWGVFKKVYIADNLAPYTNWVFFQGGAVSSMDVYLGILAFSFQLYCDFSGYSDIARGLARLFGIEIRRNFNLPYFSSNVAIFWQRWHMTLSNWFRDYVYGPIRKNIPERRWHKLALLPTMTLVGLWHGAAWKYVIFGALWGITLFIYRSIQPYLVDFSRTNRLTSYVSTMGGVLITHHLWLFFLIIFAAKDMSLGWHLWQLLFEFKGAAYHPNDFWTILYYVWPLLVMQAFQAWKDDHNVVFRLPFILRLSIYMLLLLMLWFDGAREAQKFIYFQF